MHAGMASIVQSGSPCAACKFLRRKCQLDCIFAPYFPPEQTQKFQTLHRVFGASNVSQMLHEMHPSNRGDAVISLVYEAEMRLSNPVYGCIGHISLLHQQLNQLRNDLSMAKSQLVKCQTLALANQSLLVAATAAAATSNPHPHPHLPMSMPLPLPLQQHNLGSDFLSSHDGGFDQFYQQNHDQLFAPDKQQVIQSAPNNYSARNVVAGQMNMFQYPGVTDLRTQMEPSQGFSFN